MRNPSKNEDFLTSVERHEKLHQMNKNRRLKTKDYSMASTNTGITNCVNEFNSKVTNKLKRPFSGEPIKVNKESKFKSRNNKNSKVLQRGKPMRPKTAKFKKESNKNHDFLSKNTNQILIPNNFDDKQMEIFSSHLPDIEEKSLDKSLIPEELMLSKTKVKENDNSRKNKF
jgi:hypothetical protein